MSLVLVYRVSGNSRPKSRDQGTGIRDGGEGDEDDGAIREPGCRSVEGTAANESRTDGGTALGCVVHRWSCTLGYWATPTGDRASGIGRRILGGGARCGLRDRRARSSGRLAGIAGSGCGRGGNGTGDGPGEGRPTEGRTREHQRAWNRGGVRCG